MIVGRVLPTPLSDHGVLVSVAGDPGVPQVRGRCRATGVALRCAVRRSELKEVKGLLAGLSQQLGRSGAQPDPGDAGEGGKQR
jgi:hypothetical protein